MRDASLRDKGLGLRGVGVVQMGPEFVVEASCFHGGLISRRLSLRILCCFLLSRPLVTLRKALQPCKSLNSADLPLKVTKAVHACIAQILAFFSGIAQPQLHL